MTSPRADDIVVWGYCKTNVSTLEICEWHDSLSFERLQTSVAQFIEYALRELYADFSEWFNLAEYPDVLETFDPSEKAVFLRAAGAPDDIADFDLGNCDCFSGLLAVIRQQLASRSISQLREAAKLFNWTVESGLFLCDSDAGATVYLGYPSEVAPLLLDRIGSQVRETVPGWRGPSEIEKKFIPISPMLPMLKEAFESQDPGEKVLAVKLLYWVCGLYQDALENDA